jgi:ankyrin repeat protein
MGACQKLNLESVQLLLAAGADPSEKGEEGMPLTYAVSARCPPERVGDKIAVLNALLDAGANTDELLTFLFFLCRPSNDGPPPESYRVETLLASLLARLPELPQARDPDDGATGLLVLARDHPGETRLMEMLIEAGADVRATDHGGMSVAVNLLQGSAGRTARQIQRARQSLQLLFKAGVDPAECDDDGTTLLMAAVQARYHKDSYELCETGDRAGCMYIVDVVDAVMAGSR